MSLHLSPLYLHSLIAECLNIESIEYCYFIPILAEEAEYFGDVNLTSTCNIMSQQVKQYFNHAAYVHFYMSINEQDLKQQIFFNETYTNFDDNIKLETTHKKHYDSKFKDPRLETIHGFTKKIKLAKTSSFFRYDIEKQKSLKSLRKIDQNTFEILENIKKNLDTKDFSAQISKKIFANNRKITQDDQFFLLLKNLRYRKLWKGNRWYPLIAKIAYDQNMGNMYKNFMQMSRSEKKMSKLLMEIIEAKLH